MKKLLVGFLLTLFLSTCLITGCTPARKPAPRPTKTAPTPTDRTKMTPDKQRADRIAREATQIKGVRKAVVVVSGKTAFIGLDLETREGAASKRVKDQVARRVTTAEPSLKTKYRVGEQVTLCHEVHLSSQCTAHHNRIPVAEMVCNNQYRSLLW